MKKFAKLIDLEDNAQVLLTYMYDSDDDTHYLNLSTMYDDFMGEMKLEYETEDAARKIMDDFSVEAARELRSKILQTFIDAGVTIEQELYDDDDDDDEFIPDSNY